MSLDPSTIIASGMRIYFIRRREKGRAAPRLESGWEGIVWGTPALLSLTLLASISGMLSGSGLVALFWFGLIVVAAGALIVSEATKTSRVMQLATIILLAASIIVHAARNLSALWCPAAIPVSLSFLVVCVILLFAYSKRSQMSVNEANPAPAD
ncbi:MAG: hypothetical protein AAGK67_14955 [Pseudomonadota bacterium]